MKTFIILFVTGCLLFACDNYKISGKVFQDERLIAELYSKSMDTLSFQNQQYVITTYLYRDFFPGVAPKSHPLIAYIELSETDGLAVDSDLAVKNLFVIHETSIWKSAPEKREDAASINYRQSFLSVDGPEWETGILTDVILELQKLNTADSYFLISRNQVIERTE